MTFKLPADDRAEDRHANDDDALAGMPRAEAAALRCERPARRLLGARSQRSIAVAS
jgi:hypothetical protein